MNRMKSYTNKAVWPAILILALLFFVTTPGKSNATFIDFEGWASGVILTNEYQPEGVLFSRENPDHQFSGRILTIPEYGCFPFENTVPNIMDIGLRGQPTTASFVEPGTTTPTVATDVSFLMGDGNIDEETFIVTFFDLAGNILQSDEFTTYELGLLVEFAGPVASIEFFLPSYSKSGVAMDDFSFTIASVSESCNVDIYPDTLNKKSKGKYISCFIELSEGYNVGDIDIGTVMLSVNSIIIPAESSPIEIVDYNDNGIPDLMVKFDRQSVQDGCAPGAIELTVYCETYDGTSFEGADTVLVIEKGQEHSSDDHGSVVY